ncbi:MAG TPA: helix-turn-helix domain-containing protein [Pilimelia sp.]|nr:helix-turn-helix domain-containing protein [Pilimelia sp.]
MEDEFARLLRHHRVRRRLTQEALAERAGVSARSVRDIERRPGRAPRARTVELLASALELGGEERTRFLDVGRAMFWAGQVPAAPGLAGPSRPAEAWTACHQLPSDTVDLVGRAAELAVLDRVLDPTAAGTALVTVSGPSAIGKTALAVHAGHRFADRFPDGQLYASLGAGDGDPADPADVLAQLLRSLGLDGAALPAAVEARAGMLRARLAGRRVLLVLDDAAGHGQVLPLLPAGGAAVVVTSRAQLTGLPGAVPVDLPPLGAAAALDLLCRVAGAHRVLADPPAADRLVEACGGLPLAVRIAGARLAARPHWQIRVLAERLTDERRRLDELGHGDLAVRLPLRASRRRLTPAAARTFALLGGFGWRTFPEWTVAAVLDAPPAVAGPVVEELLQARLVEEAPDPVDQPRYRFHDITRLYARECREREISPADWAGAVRRAAAGWLALARLAGARLGGERFQLDDPGVRAAAAGDDAAAVHRPVEWFEAERGTLAVLVPACVAVGAARLACALAGCAADFYGLRGHHEDWQRVTRAALAGSRRAGDRRGAAAMLRSLGTCLVECADWAPAEAALCEARALAEEAGDQLAAGLARTELGYLLSLTGRLREAEAELGAAAEMLRRTADGTHLATVVAVLGCVQRQRSATRGPRDAVRAALTRLDRAADAAAGGPARRVVALFERVGDPLGFARSLRPLGDPRP